MRRFLFGPQRAVLVLSLTQILCWGMLIYPPVLTMPHLAAAHGWSLATAMAGFSLALVTSGLLAPYIGGLIDRIGGNRVMSLGALAGAAGLALLPFADAFAAYLGCWLLMGSAMASTLVRPPSRNDRLTRRARLRNSSPVPELRAMYSPSTSGRPAVP